MKVEQIHFNDPHWTICRWRGHDVMGVSSGVTGEQLPSRFAVERSILARVPRGGRRLKFSDDDRRLITALVKMTTHQTHAPPINPLSILAAHRFGARLPFEHIGGLMLDPGTAKVLRAFLRLPATGVISPPWLSGRVPVIALERHGAWVAGVTLANFEGEGGRLDECHLGKALTPLLFPDRALDTHAALGRLDQLVTDFS
jgi:hypothetical protein